MADKKKGYVPIYRSLQDHWIWKYKEPFDHRSAWLDLLLLVNHKEDKIPVGSRVQIIKPGQRWLSYRWLGSRWGWSYRKVMRFMTQLVADGMVYVDGTPNGTLLTIVNWDNFNISGITKGITDGTTNDTTQGTTRASRGDHGRHTNNNVNNVNNEKEVKKEKPDFVSIDPPTGGGEWE